MAYHPYHQQPHPAWPQERGSAPFSVHVAAFFIYLGGALTLLAAIAFGALGAGATQLPADQVPEEVRALFAGAGLVVAAVFLVIALLYFLIARKLQRGRQWARVLVLIFAVLGVLGVALDFVMLAQAGADAALYAIAGASLIGPLLFIVLLNTSAARSWFRHKTY
ncbi:MAG: hypothetical protein GEU94_07195 [Micromonosporaceae bacterium]|nr:hypothetical protein [Micromonosporaceae bacterium]